ncbi:hypothetical protein ACRS6B_05345 [Nocardia asteroides]
MKRDQMPSAAQRPASGMGGPASKETANQPAAQKARPETGAGAAAQAEPPEPAEAAPSPSAEQTTSSGKAAAASGATDSEVETAAIQQDGSARTGAEGATVVMRKPQPPAGQTPEPKAAESTPDEKRNPPGSEDVTMAMPVVSLDDAKTVALPIQRPADGGRPGTDRVVAPPAGPVPITKPPSTPRPAAGPKQPGPQGPSAPPQHGPGVEETRPSPPRSPDRPRQVATAPSPADVQQTVPAQSMAGPRAPQTRPVAPPQRIVPQPGAGASAATPPGPNRKLLIAGAAGVLVVALVAVIVALVTMSGEESPETQVRGAITSYTEALRAGDLEALRSATCGPLHDFYQGIPSDQFAGVHKLSMERKNIPVVDSVDAIRITGDTAIAQATVYTDADPAKRSARTFDLEHTDDGWKVCDPPSGTQ